MTDQNFMLMKRLTGAPAPSGDVGIEVEVEFNKYPADRVFNMTSWREESDASLRGKFGREYKTSRAIKVSSVPKIVGNLFDFMSEGEYDRDSSRTSIHVHCNISNHTPVQLWTAVVALSLIHI